MDFKSVETHEFPLCMTQYNSICVSVSFLPRLGEVPVLSCSFSDLQQRSPPENDEFEFGYATKLSSHRWTDSKVSRDDHIKLKKLNSSIYSGHGIEAILKQENENENNRRQKKWENCPDKNDIVVVNTATVEPWNNVPSLGRIVKTDDFAKNSKTAWIDKVNQNDLLKDVLKEYRNGTEESRSRQMSKPTLEPSSKAERGRSVKASFLKKDGKVNQKIEQMKMTALQDDSLELLNFGPEKSITDSKYKNLNNFQFLASNSGSLQKEELWTNLSKDTDFEEDLYNTSLPHSGNNSEREIKEKGFIHEHTALDHVMSKFALSEANEEKLIHQLSERMQRISLAVNNQPKESQNREATYSQKGKSAIADTRMSSRLADTKMYATSSQLSVDISFSGLESDCDSDTTPTASPNHLNSSRFGGGDSLFKSLTAKQMHHYLKNEGDLYADKGTVDQEADIDDFSLCSCTNAEVAIADSLSGQENCEETNNFNRPILSENENIDCSYNSDIFSQEQMDIDIGHSISNQSMNRKIFEENLLPLASYDAHTDSFKMVDRNVKAKVLHSPKVLFSCDVPCGEILTPENGRCLNFEEESDSEVFSLRLKELAPNHGFPSNIENYMGFLAIASPKDTQNIEVEDTNNIKSRNKKDGSFEKLEDNFDIKERNINSENEMDGERLLKNRLIDTISSTKENSCKDQNFCEKMASNVKEKNETFQNLGSSLSCFLDDNEKLRNVHDKYSYKTFDKEILSVHSKEVSVKHSSTSDHAFYQDNIEVSSALGNIEKACSEKTAIYQMNYSSEQNGNNQSCISAPTDIVTQGKSPLPSPTSSLSSSTSSNLSACSILSSSHLKLSASPNSSTHSPPLPSYSFKPSTEVIIHEQKDLNPPAVSNGLHHQELDVLEDASSFPTDNVLESKQHSLPNPSSYQNGSHEPINHQCSISSAHGHASCLSYDDDSHHLSLEINAPKLEQLKSQNSDNCDVQNGICHQSQSQASSKYLTFRSSTDSHDFTSDVKFNCEDQIFRALKDASMESTYSKESLRNFPNENNVTQPIDGVLKHPRVSTLMNSKGTKGSPLGGRAPLSHSHCKGGQNSPKGSNKNFSLSNAISQSLSFQTNCDNKGITLDNLPHAKQDMDSNGLEISLSNSSSIVSSPLKHSLSSSLTRNIFRSPHSSKVSPLENNIDECTLSGSKYGPSFIYELKHDYSGANNDCSKTPVPYESILNDNHFSNSHQIVRGTHLCNKIDSEHNLACGLQNVTKPPSPVVYSTEKDSIASDFSSTKGVSSQRDDSLVPDKMLDTPTVSSGQSPVSTKDFVSFSNVDKKGISSFNQVLPNSQTLKSHLINQSEENGDSDNEVFFYLESGLSRDSDSEFPKKASCALEEVSMSMAHQSSLTSSLMLMSTSSSLLSGLPFQNANSAKSSSLSTEAALDLECGTRVDRDQACFGRTRMSSYEDNVPGWTPNPPLRSVSTPDCAEGEVRGRRFHRTTCCRSTSSVEQQVCVNQFLFFFKESSKIYYSLILDKIFLELNIS